MVDSYFEIGKLHTVCQDYALHGSFKDIEYIIISDGCSSAEHSEIGAQILCHAAKYQIESFIQSGILKECSLSTLYSALGNSIYKRAQELQKIYAITSRALEATLLIAIRVGYNVQIYCWGDGVIILSLEHAMITPPMIITENIEYSLNAPYYLVSDKEKYLNYCVNRGVSEPKRICKVTSLINGRKTFYKKESSFDYPYYFKINKNGTITRKENCFKFDEDGIVIKDYYSERVGISTTRVGISTTTTPSFERLKSVTLCSDGVCSYREKNNKDKENIGLDIIVPELINFKHSVGEFVKKRMFFFNKFVEKNCWYHYDDVSCGTIYLSD